jgi:predicted nucleic acid-binding protein
MRAYVLDTDVLVAAFRSDAGASRQVLEATRARRFELLLSVPLMLEYESVPTRPEHLAACRASVEDVSAVLDELASVGKRIELVIRTRPMLPDPNDEMVLETVRGSPSYTWERCRAAEQAKKATGLLWLSAQLNHRNPVVPQLLR